MTCNKLILGLVFSTIALCSSANAQQSDYDRELQNENARSQRDDDRYYDDRQQVRDRDDINRARDAQDERARGQDRDERYSDDPRNSDRRASDRRRTSQRDNDPAGLGVTIAEDTDNRVRVQRVFRNSPADEAGLRTNDEIVRVDAQRIDSPQQLVSVIRRKDPGSRVDLQIRRNGQTRTLTARLESRQGVLPSRVVEGRYQSQRSRYGDRYTPRGHDDLMEHIDNLQRQVDQMTRELDDLRAMLGDDPWNREWDDRNQDFHSRN